MDDLTPAEAADAARRIIGQLEALQRWALDRQLDYAAARVTLALVEVEAARKAIDQAERLSYRGRVVEDRRPVKPLGGGR